MSEHLTDLFAKIEKYIINQAQTYKGLPNEVLSPISDIDNQHIAKRLQILQNEQEIEFSIDEILLKSTQVEVSVNEELNEENESSLLEELNNKDELDSTSENEVSSELSDLPNDEFEPQFIEESSELEIASDSEFDISSELSDLPSDEIEPQLIEESIELEVTTDSEFDVPSELSVLTSAEIEPEVIEETSELEADSDSELEDEIILESESIVQKEESVESLEKEIPIDETEEEFLSISDCDNSIEEISDITSETSVEESPIEDEFYNDSENEEIDLSSNESEFSLEDNTDSSLENESTAAEDLSEEVKEEPVEESLQFDLFGPIPSKPSAKATYQTSEPLRTPSLFDIKPSQKKPSSPQNLKDSSKLEEANKSEIKKDLPDNAVLEKKTEYETESEPKNQEENPKERPIQAIIEPLTPDSDSEKNVNEISESTQIEEIQATEKELIEDSYKTEASESSPKSQKVSYTESTKKDSISDLLSEPPLQTSFKETSSLIATYIPISMIDPNQLQKELNECVSLEDLKLLCEKHKDLLRTDLEDTNLVFGVGNPNAKLVIVGEAPGENEDKQGEPFVGKAGQLLDKILEAIQFSRKDIYIANILKHRPPKNRDPLPEERERSLPFLLRQIEIIQPKLVLCLGRISARTLLGLPDSVSLAQIRGKFHPFLNNTIELTATYHPASLLRNPNWKKPTWEDVQMIRKRYDELS